MYLRHQAYTLYYHVCILVFLHVFAFSMLLRCMLKFKRLACGIEDVLNTIQFSNKREIEVKYNNETLPFCFEPKYLGVALDRSFKYRRHLESLRKKLTSRVALLRRLAGSGWGAEATARPMRKPP